MIRYDGVEFEWVPGTAALQMVIGDTKNGQRSRSVYFQGELRSLGGGIRRGDLAGWEEMKLVCVAHKAPVSDWRELSGMEFEVKDRREGFFKRMLLKPPGPQVIGAPISGSSGHCFKLRQTSGYHFTLEAGAAFFPLDIGAGMMFGFDKKDRPTMEQLEEMVEELTILEELPLAAVTVFVPLNAKDPVAFAQRAAKELLGFEETVPLPGREPDFAPLTGLGESHAHETQHVTLVTPWARG